MPEDRYMTFKFDKKIIEEIDDLLKETPTIEYKNRTEFIYTAIKEHVLVTRIKNTLNPSGHSKFHDLLVKKRIEAFDEVAQQHGVRSNYYSSGLDIKPKGWNSTTKEEI